MECSAALRAQEPRASLLSQGPNTDSEGPQGLQACPEGALPALARHNAAGEYKSVFPRSSNVTHTNIAATLNSPFLKLSQEEKEGTPGNRVVWNHKDYKKKRN